MEASKLNVILEKHRLWLAGKGGIRANLYGADLEGASLRNVNLTDANLKDACLRGANLEGANLEGANLRGADLQDADLKDAILPDVSWVIPGCLVQLNNILYGFYLAKERKRDSFGQDSIGFFIQDNLEERTFDMFVEDRIIRNIPNWVKLSGLKQIESV
jgi:uncharacterized protein YjbI with pentapeptide repeats